MTAAGQTASSGGADAKFSYAECNEDLAVYGLLKHTHMPEMSATIRALAGSEKGLVFTPHLVPMTRGILATIYCRGSVDTATATSDGRPPSGLAASTMPFDSMPISLAGLRFATITMLRPTSCSG